ncbi:hypothetical protein ACVWW4_005995 [Bradyrhizobium sp. LB7.1]
MRASIAYFVGAGTIVAAMAIGLGGGIVAGNIMHPIAPKQGPDTGKMAQRAEPVAAPTTTSAPSERVPISHRLKNVRRDSRRACAGAGRSKA